MTLKNRQLGFINKILPVSAVDGPGNRLVFFLQGCNLNCIYCHNPETISYCTACGKCIEKCGGCAIQSEKNKIVFHPAKCLNCGNCLENCIYNSTPKYFSYGYREIEKIIQNYSDFISGITISGGEPTMQPDLTSTILLIAKKKNKSAFIDTNANCDENVMEKLSCLFDKAMIDLKAFYSEEHIRLTGSDNSKILKNTAFLLKSKKVYEIRTVVFSEEKFMTDNILKIAEFIARLNKTVKYKLIVFRKEGTRKGHILKTPKDEYLSRLKKECAGIGLSNIAVN